jgi:hypothetical protein
LRQKQRAEAAEDEARIQRTQVDQHKEALELADQRIRELENGRAEMPRPSGGQ